MAEYMDGVSLNGPFSITTGEAISPTKGGLLVTLNSSGLLVKCGAAGTIIGVVYSSYASGALATVFPPRGRHKLECTAAIAAGDMVKPGAAGQVAPEATVTTKTLNTCGQAETATSNQNDAFWCFLLQG